MFQDTKPLGYEVPTYLFIFVLIARQDLKDLVCFQLLVRRSMSQNENQVHILYENILI